MGREVLSVEEVEMLGVAGQALDADPQFHRLGICRVTSNLFEALGMVRQEQRHSHRLALLLQPSRSHGLGGALLHALFGDKAVAAHLDKALRKVSGRASTGGTTEGAQLTPTTPSPSGTAPSAGD